MKKKVFIISFIVLIIDEISKLIIEAILPLNNSIKIINNFFNLTYVHNEGAAWSILNGQRFILIIISLLALIFLYKYLHDFKENKRNTLAFGLLFGGIIGNLFDRLIFGYVRDFLDFKIFGYNYPIFNISDICIFLGTILLLIATFKGEDYGSSSKRISSHR